MRRLPLLLAPLLVLAAACGGDGDAALGPPAGSGAPRSEQPAGGSGTGNEAGEPGSGPAAPSSSGVGGRVTTPDGAPVAMATVTRAPVGSGEPVSQEAGVTDSDGRYFWPLGPGTWEVTVTAPVGGTVSRQVVVREGERAVLDVVVEP